MLPDPHDISIAQMISEVINRQPLLVAGGDRCDGYQVAGSTLVIYIYIYTLVYFSTLFFAIHDNMHKPTNIFFFDISKIHHDGVIGSLVLYILRAGYFFNFPLTQKC